MEIESLIRPPEWIRKLYAGSVWSTGEERCQLTFDDGPGPITEALLDWLENWKIQAHFFCTPRHVIEKPEIAIEIIKRGHLLGTHFLHHRSYWLCSKNRFVDDLTKSVDIIEDKTGSRVTTCRAPYGRLMPFQESWIAEAGLQHWFWSLNSYDFKAQSEIELFNRLQMNIKKGDVILFHDGKIYHPNLLTILEKLRDSGISFITKSSNA